jgi:hypothetical protein
MIDTILLDHINKRLQEITDNHLEEFGGIPIILMGDFYQLPPTLGEPMYKTIFHKVPSNAIFKPSQIGCNLFKSFA